MPGRARTLSDGGINDERPDGPSLRRGETVGRYVVVDRIGAGAMGVVHAAYDPDLDRRVALKLLAQASTIGIDRMMREAQAAAKVVHPNVVAVHDVGAHGARMFVAMELVDGESLAAWLRREPRPWREVLAMLMQAGRGLAAAHAVGIVHRDFKPDNVLVGRDGRARVADFGLARAIDRAPPDPSGAGRSTLASGGVELTATGALLGTPAYMAPEQHLRMPCDARADQFSFCVATWEALFGKRPFGGATLEALSVAVTEGRLEQPSDARGVPPRIRMLLQRGLAVAPADRFPTMDALLDALAVAAEPRRRGPWIAATAAFVALGAGVLATRETAVPEPDPCATIPIDEQWSPAAKDELVAAFAATKAPFASDVARSVTARLDDARRRWSTQWLEVCPALHAPELDEDERVLLERRRGCLEDRQRELEAAIGLLRKPDAAVVQGAFEVLGGVRDVERCRDDEALRHRLDPPPAELLREVGELRAGIERALVLNRAGDLRSAEATMSELEPRVRATGWMPIEVEHEAARARLLRSDTAPRVEIPRLRTAFDRALEIGDDMLAAEFAIELAWQLGYRDKQTEEALQWLATGWALLRRSGGDWVLEVRALNNEAVIESESRHYDRADELFARALALAQEHDPEGVRPLQLRANLAAFTGIRGDYPRALALFRESLDGYAALLGDAHPRVADVAGNLGLVYSRMGDLAQARHYLEEGMRIQDRALPPEHPARESVLSGLAETMFLQGELAAAVPLMHRVDAIHVASHGEGAMKALQWRILMVRRLLEAVPRPDEELAELTAAVVTGADAGKDPALQLDAQTVRLQVALARGDLAAAAPAVQRMRELLPIVPRMSEEQKLTTQSVLASAAVATGDRKAAAAALAAIDAVVPEELRARHDVAVDLLRAAEAAVWLDREPARALALAERARVRLEGVGADRTGLAERIAGFVAKHRGR